MSDTDGDDETSRAGKRADSGCEDNDEAFSDIDFPTNAGTGSAAKPELTAVLDKIQALSTTGCSCAMNHYLQFGDGQLCRFSLGWVGCQKETRKLFVLGELAASLQGASIGETGANTHFLFLVWP